MALDNVGKSNLSKILETRRYHEVIAANKMHVEQKNKFRNLERCMHIQRREGDLASEHLKSNAEASLIEHKFERVEALARELDKIKREDLNQQKMRQALRENSHELRELQSKLGAAYVSKELAAQRAEKEARKLEEKLQDQKAYDILVTAQLSRQELLKKEAEDEIKKKFKYRQELQDQMIINEKRRRFLYEEFLREKKMIDEIIQRIHAEDEREIEEKMCRMLKTRQEMDAFKKAQEIWRKKERDEIELENKRVQEYLMARAILIQNQEKIKHERNVSQAKVTEEVARQIYEEECKRKEREEIMMELYQEEQRHASDKKHHAEVEKEIRQRVETRRQLTQQMQERKERLEQQAAEDEIYKNELIAKMIEDDKLEQLSAQKKRMKMLQLRRDIEQMMIDKRQKHAEEMQLLMKLKEQEDLEQENRKQMIEEERLRMLKEHAVNLIGYLPKGVLRKDDLPLLRADIDAAQKRLYATTQCDN